VVQPPIISPIIRITGKIKNKILFDISLHLLFLESR